MCVWAVTLCRLCKEMCSSRFRPCDQFGLTFYRPDSAFQAGAFPVFSGRRGQIRGGGQFLDAILPLWRERTVLYWILFHYFDQFLAEYESRFEKEYGFLRPIVKEVVERYLDCGNPHCGFARIRCPSCGEERLLMFSCRSRGYAE